MKSKLDEGRLVEMGVMTDCTFLLASRKEDGCESLRQFMPRC